MSKYDYTFRVVAALVVLLWLPVVSNAQEQNKTQSDRQKECHGEPDCKSSLKSPPSGLTLLPGYRHEGESDFEGNITGKIWKKDGLEIGYGMGPVFGQVVQPQYKDSYLQYWEKVVGGRVVRFAFTKEKYLWISMPLDDLPNSISGANFSTTVEKPEDAADMVTMALSLLKNSNYSCLRLNAARVKSSRLSVPGAAGRRPDSKEAPPIRN